MPTRRLYQEFWMSVCVTHIFTPISFQKIGLKLKFYDRITNLCSFYFVNGVVRSSQDQSNFSKCQMWRGLDWNILLCGSLPWGVSGEIKDLPRMSMVMKIMLSCIFYWAVFLTAVFILVLTDNSARTEIEKQLKKWSKVVSECNTNVEWKVK